MGEVEPCQTGPKKQASIGDEGAAASAGAFACDDSVASSSRSAASPASWLPLPLLFGGSTVVVCSLLRAKFGLCEPGLSRPKWSLQLAQKLLVLLKF